MEIYFHARLCCQSWWCVDVSMVNCDLNVYLLCCWSISTPLDLCAERVWPPPFTHFDSLDFLFVQMFYSSTGIASSLFRSHCASLCLLAMSHFIRVSQTQIHNEASATLTLCLRKCTTHVIIYTKMDWDALRVVISTQTHNCETMYGRCGFKKLSWPDETYFNRSYSTYVDTSTPDRSACISSIRLNFVHIPVCIALLKVLVPYCHE